MGRTKRATKAKGSADQSGATLGYEAELSAMADALAVNHLPSTGTASFALANVSVSSEQSREGETRKNLVDVDLVDWVGPGCPLAASQDGAQL
jgi:hypothetical protein